MGLLSLLTANPRAGAVIPGFGGVRKLRYADAVRGVGVRGGLRVLYRYHQQQDMVTLYLAYRKSEQVDVLPHQRAYIQRYQDQDPQEDDVWPPTSNN